MTHEMPESVPSSLSYLMLFCAILVAKSRNITLGESIRFVPLDGDARTLASELVASSTI